MKETTSLVRIQSPPGFESRGSLKAKNQLWVRKAKNSSLKKITFVSSLTFHKPSFLATAQRVTNSYISE